MARSILSVFLLAVALTGCGGGGSDDQATFDDSAASTQVSRDGVYPVSTNYPSVGTYTVTLTGDYKVTGFDQPDQLAVWFSYSGHGTIVGEAQPNYAIANNGQTIKISQTLTVHAASDGQWQLSVLCFTGGSTGTLSNLTLHSVLN